MIVPVQGDTGDTIPGDAGGELVVIIRTADIKRFVFLWSAAESGYGCTRGCQHTSHADQGPSQQNTSSTTMRKYVTGITRRWQVCH